MSESKSKADVWTVVGTVVAAAVVILGAFAWAIRAEATTTTELQTVRGELSKATAEIATLRTRIRELETLKTTAGQAVADLAEVRRQLTVEQTSRALFEKNWSRDVREILQRLTAIEVGISPKQRRRE